MALDWRARTSAPAWPCSSLPSPPRAPLRSATSPRSTGATSGSTCGYAIWAPASSGSPQNASPPSRPSDRIGVVQLCELRIGDSRGVVAQGLCHLRADARLSEGPECLRRLPDVEDAQAVAVHPRAVGDQPVGWIPLRVKRSVYRVVLVSRETLEIQLHEYGHISFSLSRGIGQARFRPCADRGSRGSLAPAP